MKAKSANSDRLEFPRRLLLFTMLVGLSCYGWPSFAGEGLDAIKAGAESSIRSDMIDPESTRFEWPYEFKATKSGGFYTCGRVNSKNRYGGYTGAIWFSVAVKDGKITSLQTEETSPWIAGQCASAARKGELRPVANN